MIATPNDKMHADFTFGRFRRTLPRLVFNQLLFPKIHGNSSKEVLKSHSIFIYAVCVALEEL
jgi:hypothetical protein